MLISAFAARDVHGLVTEFTTAITENKRHLGSATDRACSMQAAIEEAIDELRFSSRKHEAIRLANAAKLPQF